MGKASSLLRPRKALHVMRLQMSQCLSLLLLEARGGTAPQVAKLLRSFQLPRRHPPGHSYPYNCPGKCIPTKGHEEGTWTKHCQRVPLMILLGSKCLDLCIVTPLSPSAWGRNLLRNGLWRLACMLIYVCRVFIFTHICARLYIVITRYPWRIGSRTKSEDVQILYIKWCKTMHTRLVLHICKCTTHTYRGPTVYIYL